MKASKAFTLIELLVVIAIIGVLSSVVIASMNSARKKSRDARRKADLSALQRALELYYDKFNTYRVSGAGAGGTGIGYVARYSTSGTIYPKEITRELYDQGFLGKPLLDDPSTAVGSGYMLYLCSSNERYSLSATLETEGLSDLDLQASGLCNTSGPNRVQLYGGKNYVVGN